ncbi:protein of unknown function [Sanguibacter gelidistatuariae]|uniref:DUF1772 domain-containing protein n=1 Tax=Sanguibacter gelidistatuariae TaxID=1814289 RepID=A0A1G6MRC4_9MICO|nr:anthrone oxygenase family protein [Sanguibacter gelidistatuariae]SDC58001.1 protein of unknown function [Sanguibacter gelidistatuariae]
MTAIASTRAIHVEASTQALRVAIRVAALAGGLLAGALVAVLLADITLRGDPAGYIAFHQATTVLYTATLPALGAVMAIAIVTSIAQHGPSRLLVPALICGALGMLITVLVHFPLNATIMAWPVGVVPTDFTSVATQWLVAHLARTLLTITSFVLVLTALARVEHASAE